MIPMILRQNQREKINRLRYVVLTAAGKSTLYQSRYQKYNLSQDFERQFNTLPLLSRADYYQGMKPPKFPLLIGRLENCYIFTSGGTTGEVKLTAWHQNFVDNWTNECFHSLSAVGLSAGDIVINLFFPGIWATHTLINKSLEKACCRIVPLGGKISLDILATYIERFQATVLIGVPSFIVRLTEYLDTTTASQKSEIQIQKIFYAGEFLSKGQAKFIKDRLGCQVDAFLYSSTDTGTIGIKCQFCDTNQYHVADSIYLEVLDVDSRVPVHAGIPGELIVTSLVNEKAPCIRYRVGDLGMLHEKTCRCGNQSPVFTLLGRVDDEVKVAGYLISPETVQKGLGKFPQLSQNFQLIAEEVGQKTRLTIACEILPTASLDAEIDLSRKIAKSLVQSYDMLKVLIAQGYCLPIDVKLLPPGAIFRNPQTGKINRVKRRGHGAH